VVPANVPRACLELSIFLRKHEWSNGSATRCLWDIAKGVALTRSMRRQELWLSTSYGSWGDLLSKRSCVARSYRWPGVMYSHELCLSRSYAFPRVMRSQGGLFPQELCFRRSYVFWAVILSQELCLHPRLRLPKDLW